MNTPESRLAAIWVTDIVGFSGLSARDQALALSQLESFQRQVAEVVAAGGGRVATLVGDSALAEFASASAAVRAAVELHQAFTGSQLRIGIHIGEVVDTADGGFHGDGVKVATRLQEEAEPGEILISDDVRRQLGSSPLYRSVPLGVRKLRGLDEPVTAHAVFPRGDSDPGQQGLGWRLTNLLRSRRTRVMTSVMGLYFATLWTAVEVTSFIEARYQLTPNITEVVIAALLLILPSVLLVTYYHSGPTRQTIPLPEKVGVPANLIAASIIVVLAFGTQDIGAVMQTVAVVDENGEEVMRQVPRSEYRKRLAVFPFTVRGPESAAWLGEGVAYGVGGKLSQDIFFDIQSPAHFRPRLARTPYPDGRGLPGALQREIAEERHLGHYLSGSVEVGDNGGLTVTMELHDTQRGRPIARHQLTGENLFELIDQLSDLVKNDLGIPEWHLETVTDLPMDEMYTASVEAYEAYMIGGVAMALRDDYATARRELQRAVDLDPTFTFAHFALFALHLMSNEGQLAAQASANVMEYLYRLPERLQLMARHNHAFMQQDTERAFAIIDMGAGLYPDDLEIQLVAAQLDMVRNRPEGALERYRHIMQLAPDRHQDLHVMAALSERIGDTDEARQFRQTYVDRFPDESDGHIQLGDFLRRYGDHAAATVAYERASTLEGENPEVIRRLAMAQWNQHRFDDAMRLLDSALESSRSSQQRVPVLVQRSSYHEARGMIGAAMADMQSALAEAATFQPPIGVLLDRLHSMRLLALSGQPELAAQNVDAIAAQLQPPWDRLAAVGRLGHALVTEDVEAIDAAVAVVEELSTMVGLEHMRAQVAFARGRAAELRGDCRTALPYYEEERRLNPSDSSIGHQIARCHLALGDLGAANTEMQQALRIRPSVAPAHVTMARIMLARGDRAAARRHLETALVIWAPADAAYAPAAEARSEFENNFGE